MGAIGATKYGNPPKFTRLNGHFVMVGGRVNLDDEKRFFLQGGMGMISPAVRQPVDDFNILTLQLGIGIRLAYTKRH